MLAQEPSPIIFLCPQRRASSQQPWVLKPRSPHFGPSKLSERPNDNSSIYIAATAMMERLHHRNAPQQGNGGFRMLRAGIDRQIDLQPQAGQDRRAGECPCREESSADGLPRHDPNVAVPTIAIDPGDGAIDGVAASFHNLEVAAAADGDCPCQTLSPVVAPGDLEQVGQTPQRLLSGRSVAAEGQLFDCFCQGARAYS